MCGDGIRYTNDEYLLKEYLECDDGNIKNGDGCSSTCAIESGYECEHKTPLKADECTSSEDDEEEIPEFDDYLDVETLYSDTEEFKASLTFQEDNTKFIQITFTNNPISKNYLMYRTKITIDVLETSEFEYEMQFLNDNVMEIQFLFQKSFRNAEMLVVFEKHETIEDVYLQALETESVPVEISLVTVYTSEEKDTAKNIAEAMEPTLGSILSSVSLVIIITTVSSFFGSNSAGRALGWSIVSLLQNISYFTLIDAHYPENAVAFLMFFIRSSLPYYEEANAGLLELLDSKIDSPYFSEQGDPLNETQSEENQTLRILNLYQNSGDDQESEPHRRMLVYDWSIPWTYYSFGIMPSSLQNIYIYFFIVVFQILFYLVYRLVYRLCRRRLEDKEDSVLRKGLQNAIQTNEFGTFLDGFRTEITEVLIFSMINLKYSWHRNVFFGFSYIVSGLLIILCMFFGAWVAIYMRKKDFRENPRVSSLFGDFKSENFFTKYFLVVELTKAALVSLFFATLYEVQVPQMSLIFVTNVLYLLVLVVVRPYKTLRGFWTETIMAFGFMVASLVVLILVVDLDDSIMQIETRWSYGVVLIIVLSLMLGAAFVLMFIDLCIQIYRIYRIIKAWRKELEAERIARERQKYVMKMHSGKDLFKTTQGKIESIAFLNQCVAELEGVKRMQIPSTLFTEPNSSRDRIQTQEKWDLTSDDFVVENMS